MKGYLYIITAFVCFISSRGFAQEEVKIETVSIDSTALKNYTIDPLAPARAAFYSAIVPGLGQIYNKKYWKVPLVYGGIALSVYYYTFNNDNYHLYRDAYKDLLAGRTVKGNLANFDSDRLLRGQKFYQRNRDLSAFCLAGVYLLSIIDANVDAHLMQFNVNDNLSFSPTVQPTGINYNFVPVMSMSYRF